MAMSGAQKTSLYNSLMRNVNEISQDGILITLEKFELGAENVQAIRRAKVLANKIVAGMTGAEATELNALLTTTKTELGDSGLLGIADRIFQGDIQKGNVGNTRSLLSNLLSMISASVSPSSSASRSPSRSASASESRSPSASGSRSPSTSPSPSASPSRSPSNSASASASRSPSTSASASFST